VAWAELVIEDFCDKLG
jgi:hypothetical protein